MSTASPRQVTAAAWCSGRGSSAPGVQVLIARAVSGSACARPPADTDPAEQPQSAPPQWRRRTHARTARPRARATRGSGCPAPRPAYRTGRGPPPSSSTRDGRPLWRRRSRRRRRRRPRRPRGAPGAGPAAATSSRSGCRRSGRRPTPPLSPHRRLRPPGRPHTPRRASGRLRHPIELRPAVVRRVRRARARSSSCPPTTRVPPPRTGSARRRPRRGARAAWVSATSVQRSPSNTSVCRTNLPSAWPPTTTISSPTTAAAAAARDGSERAAAPRSSAQGIHAVRLLGGELLARYEAADHHRVAFVRHGRSVVQRSRQARLGSPAVRPGS